MPARLRLVALAATLCAVAAVIGVLLADARRDEAPAAVVPASGFAGAERPEGARAPALTRLRDQDGRPLDMAALRGGPVVMTFIYSTCEDACPSQVQAIRQALDRFGRDVPVIGVSVDPATDTPASARAFLLEQRMTGRMRFALGSRAALEPVWRAYGIAPQTDALEHSAYVVVVDESGTQRVGWPHDRLTADGLAHDLEELT